MVRGPTGLRQESRLTASEGARAALVLTPGHHMTRWSHHVRVHVPGRV